MKFGSIKENKIMSPLEQMATLRPSSSKSNMIKVVAPLMLTSLVDAFAVIVIYLLASTQQSGSELQMDKNISLPQASHSQSLQPGVNLKVKGNDYIINDTIISINQVAQYLVNLNKELKDKNDSRHGNLIIQADKNADFSGLSPILVVAAQTGFENVRFAVIGE